MFEEEEYFKSKKRKATEATTSARSVLSSGSDRTHAFSDPGVGGGETSRRTGPSSKLPKQAFRDSKNTESPQPPPPVDNKVLIYQVTKHIETNRDLYFVRLVAGSIKRSFESIIKVEGEKEKGNSLSGKVIVNVAYTYSDELLSSWASVIERIRGMMSDSAKLRHRTVESIHNILINNDSSVVAFAKYVAFLMMTESNNLIPRNKTRYMLADQAATGENFVVELMRAMHFNHNILREDLQNMFQ
jgi:hypothetical protein